LSGTITLTSLLPTINSNLTINGPGANVLAISGNHASGIFSISGTVAINGLTLKDGNAGSGGGIENTGTVTVSNSTLTRNLARVNGGAIENYGARSLSTTVPCPTIWPAAAAAFLTKVAQ